MRTPTLIIAGLVLALMGCDDFKETAPYTIVEAYERKALESTVIKRIDCTPPTLLDKSKNVYVGMSVCDVTLLSGDSEEVNVAFEVVRNGDDYQWEADAK